ncbi:hypothetical protein N5U20_07710 [Aliarcobacter butzleri]|nr:hypothetical protein [Aliarcobacter butzleri]MCT7613095.1 hypothetical protein [Aliarcobacter butzleri]MCT7641710.1 hypothetical protein [Aliarcobacter butzleri]
MEINKMKFKYEVITEQNKIQIQQIKCINNKLENTESKNEEKKEILK